MLTCFFISIIIFSYIFHVSLFKRNIKQYLNIFGIVTYFHSHFWPISTDIKLFLPLFLLLGGVG